MTLTIDSFNLHYPDETRSPIRSVQLRRIVPKCTPSLLKLDLPHPMHSPEELHEWMGSEQMYRGGWEALFVSEEVCIEVENEEELS